MFFIIGTKYFTWGNTDDHADSLQPMQFRRAVHRKNGNEFSDAVFYYPDDSDQREEKIDRMPKLQDSI